MAELATIARPYAEALFRSAPEQNAAAIADQLDVLAQVVSDPQLRQFADHPNAQAEQVYSLIASVSKLSVRPRAEQLLRVVIDNGRLSAFGEIAGQFRTLVNARSAVFEARIHSAYALDDVQLADTVAALERRFGRKLQAAVEIDPSLIGGIRVVVGDEVLDTSIKARLAQMKVALTG
jgi:F-type H+-transporting ATPase subunit delta